MPTESQIDLWRKNVNSNLRKAADAAVAIETGEPGPGISPKNRMQIALVAAEVTSNLMISERIGQLHRLLSDPDSALGESQERVRTGEQLVQSIVKAAENSEGEIGEELRSFITMAEDWLDPESLVSFSTPEAVEEGRDPHSQAEEKGDDEEVDHHAEQELPEETPEP